MPKTVAVDFDGVIHAYSKGWCNGTIYDAPIPGAFDALRQLMSKYAVVIFTTRDVRQVADWLLDHEFEQVTIGGDSSNPFWNKRDNLLVTNTKPAAIAYIDDRAIRFTNWKQALEDLENFAVAKNT